MSKQLWETFSDFERPPIKSWQFPANFEGNPFFPSLVYDAWQFNRGWDALHFCFTNPNYPRGDNILPFFLSLSPIAENSRETRSIFYLQRVTLEMANEVEFENFENYENYANFQESSIELKNSCLSLSKKVEKTELKKKVCFDIQLSSHRNHFG